ncbi:MAG: copper homeostasis protein CutC [Muribaculaceae bacterium]|nr:copper homeostasis protein CutC [Muribaculaceae bacterium]
MTVEICCGSLRDVLAAKAVGAERIELCSGLAEGGLTPSYALIRAAVAAGIKQVNVLIRPRPGDFLYTEPEIELMSSDIWAAIEAGATGIVIGALTAEGDIDTTTCRRLIDAAIQASAAQGRPKPYITFHRAFDVCREAGTALEAIISLGADCLLTSGMAPTALEGASVIKKLVEQSAGRLSIMAGAGISPQNGADIIAATGVTAIHSTARCPMESNMLFRRPSVSMGVPGCDEYAPKFTSTDIVKKLLKL